jgi:hypothetical protein
MTLDNRYQHRCVADLSWAVSSPPLLLLDGNDCSWFSECWYQDRYNEIEQQLRALDRDPAKLESLLAAQKDRRLGNYFETLWSFALDLNSRYQLIERNLQIHDGENTLGEMDFIVLDNETGRYAHWELAIKFYLGMGDTVNHNAWHGPGQQDRLDLKLDHLLSRQTRLGRHPVAKAQLEERGIVIDDCAVILKGRLFYPWPLGGPEYFPQHANPSHLRGQWLTRQQLIQSCGADARFMPLIRSGWMAEISKDHAADGYSTGALMRLVDSGLYRLPMQVIRLEAASGVERLFIVNDDWPQSGT